jgi:hypothetical protein
MPRDSAGAAEVYQVHGWTRTAGSSSSRTLWGGTPYEVEVWYNRNGEMYFKGGWSQFAEDHDLHQGFFMIFGYHVGMLKFDVKIDDCT